MYRLIVAERLFVDSCDLIISGCAQRIGIGLALMVFTNLSKECRNETLWYDLQDRLNREIGCYTRAESIFSDRPSSLRLVGAALAVQNVE